MTRPAIDLDKLRAIVEDPNKAKALPPTLIAHIRMDLASRDAAMTDPAIDYERLRGILASPAGARIPEALRARMTADIAQHDLEQTTAAPSDVTQIATPFSEAQRHAQGVLTATQENQGVVNTLGNLFLKQPTMFAMQVAHDLTLGISPKPYGNDPSVTDPLTGAMEIPTRIISGIGTMMMQGAGLMRGLSYVGKVPIVTRALEFIPGRIKEIGLGALVNGGIDAMRVDGLDREPNGAINDPSWLDPSAKIAKPLAELGVPDRVALGLGGAVVGGAIGSILIGVAKGWQAGREAMATKLSPDVAEQVKNALVQAGVDPGTMTDKYQIAKTFIKNFRKIALNEDLATPMADQLTREAYIASEISMGNANLASAADVEQQARLTAGIFRQNPGGVNVVTGLTSDEAVTAAQSRLGVKLSVAKVERVPAVSPVTELKPGQVVTGPDGLPYTIKQPHQFSDAVEIPTEVQEAYVTAANNQRAALAASGKAYIIEVLPDKVDGRYVLRVGHPDRGFSQVTLGNYINSDELLKDEIDQMVKAKIKSGIPTAVLGAQRLENVVARDATKIKVVGSDGKPTAFAASDLKSGFGPPKPAQFDLLVGRPIYEYPAFEDQSIYGRLTNKVTNVLKKMAKEAATNVRAPRTTEAFILADGEPIRGGLNTGPMIEKMRLQKPVIDGVARGDVGLREAAKFVRLELTDEGLTIDLPSQLSKEQFVSIGKAIDTMKFNKVTVNLGEKSVVLNTPIGAVVQDRIAELIPPKQVSSSITPEMVKQYQKTGVFTGQAVVLPDGTAAEIVHKHGAAGYKVRESLTGKEFVVGAKNLTILPTALAGEMQGSNLFASYMSDAERIALAKLRKAQLEGWAEPITKYRDFESFANSRGYMAEQLRAGKVRLSKVNEGGNAPVMFKDIPSAIEWVRKDAGPVAELANEEVTKLLGPDRNMGWIGGGGPPPRFNEIMPIDWKRMEATMESLPTDRGPGFFENLLKPMMPLLRDLDQRFGTQMYKAAYNMQTQGVARNNFLNTWYHGRGPGLPDGVKPLKEIIHEAGPTANRELIGNWLEVRKGTPDEVDLLRTMTPKERQAASDLRDWFTAAYPALGIDAPFVEEYMPRYREAVQAGNGKTFQEFMNSIVNDPLKVPKGTDFVSDHIREGLIDTYEKDAFKVAVQYLRAGAKNRFMKQAQDEAREMVRMIADKNPNLALPLGNMLQAMGGFEFTEQRAMIKETFLGLLDRIPGGVNKLSDNQDLAERFTNWSTSLVYSSTMGFRLSLAARNAKDIYVMAYPLYAGPRFNEAVGRALTKAGKEEAMAARAISEYAGGMLTAETQEIMEKLPEWAKNLQHASTYLYDSADSFTRAGTYFAAKFKAEDALAAFAKRVKNLKDPKLLENAKDKLIRDSKVYFHGDEVVDEFLRLAATSPDKAAEFAGKIASDMTNFLYGRGMQSRWMRSIGGRLMGQFGSWSMWYADYLMRMVRAVGRPEYRADALAALGRHALVNAAILSVGKFVLDVDMSRWASYGALFYSGGPGWQIATGASTLMRGLGDASSAGEDPLAQSRITQGASMIWHTLPAFVPFLSAGRDVYRMATPYDQTDFLAATLGTRTTKDYQARRKVDILLGDYSSSPFQTTSPALSAQLNAQATGLGIQPVDLRQIPAGGVQTTGVQAPSAGAGQPSQPSSTMAVSQKNMGSLPAVTPPNLKPNLQNEVKSTIEPKPPKGF